MNTQTDTKQPTPTERIVESLKALRDYKETDNPTGTPSLQYQQLQLLPLRIIVCALNTAELDDDEYQSLLQFAANELHTQELDRSINHTQSEFTFLRQRLGASQQWIAEQIGVSPSTIRRWEDPNSGYVPSEKAWKRLEQLEHDEYEWAMKAVNERITYLDRLIRLCSKTPFTGDEPLYDPDDPAIRIELGVHNYRDQTEYETDVRDAKPIIWDDSDQRDDQERDEIENELLSYQHEHNLWSVFEQAGDYMIQNAITERIYEIVAFKAYDRSLTNHEVATSFAVGAGSMSFTISQ